MTNFNYFAPVSSYNKKVHTKKQNIVINNLHLFDANGSFSHVEAIPTEYATCKEGHTFVLVSTAYISLIISVNRLSRTNTSGRKSCRFGKMIYIAIAEICVVIINFICHLELSVLYNAK